MVRDEISFGCFRLDLRNRRLSSNGVPIRLKTTAFDILTVLASAQGEAVSKGEIMDRVWPGLAVEENNIQVHISALRKALSEDRGAPRPPFHGTGARISPRRCSAIAGRACR